MKNEVLAASNSSVEDSQLDLLGDFLKDEAKSSETSMAVKSLDSPANSTSLTNTTSRYSELFPETLLIIDTETTGLDVNENNCLEIGAILFHVKSRCVLAQQSFLLPVDSNDAQKINRIPAHVTRLSQPWKEGLVYFEHLIDCCDAVVAHNATFDRQWFGKEPLPAIIKPWICSMEDISWPENLQLRPRPSVRDLALSYEVPVWNAHRALTDCIYLSEVFRRTENLETLLIQALEPRTLMRAKVSYENRNLAKKAGFVWNNPVPGAWVRRLSQREATALNFDVIPVEPG